MYPVEESTGGVTVLAVLHGFAGAWWLVPIVLFREPWWSVILLVPAFANFAVAAGLIAFDRWAWAASWGVAAFDLLAVPFGTVIGVVALVLLSERDVKVALGRHVPPPNMPVIPPPLLRPAGPRPPPPHPGHRPVLQPIADDDAHVRAPLAGRECGSCGAPAHPGDAFCGRCGAAAP